MTHADCTRFLAWALPRLGLRPAGYQRVGRRACKRISRRVRELGLCDVAAYRQLLEQDEREWAVLDAAVRMPISRFLRDRPVFEQLATHVLPRLADEARRRGDAELRAWSLGCASGEEPYSLNIVWKLLVQPAVPSLPLRILATDADPVLLGRAAEGTYPDGSLREVPAPWRDLAFERRGPLWSVVPALRGGIVFELRDVRVAMPEGPFDLVLCRNVVFTYFDERWQRRMLEALHARLVPGGALVLGRRERLPEADDRFAALPGCPEILLETAHGAQVRAFEAGLHV